MKHGVKHASGKETRKGNGYEEYWKNFGFWRTTQNIEVGTVSTPMLDTMRGVLRCFDCE